MTLIVWLPQGLLLILGFVVLIVVIPHIVHCCKNGNHLSHGYVLYPLHFFISALFFMWFPTIILVLAYPTQMLAIMIFALVYLFATTILAAILIQMFNPSIFKLRKNEQSTTNETGVQYPWWYYAIVFISYMIFMLFALFIGVLSLYSLLIGKGSAINTAPLFVISLLPSALVSGVAPIAQIIVFNGKNGHRETPTTSGHGQSGDQLSSGQLSGGQLSSDQPSTVSKSLRRTPLHKIKTL